MCMYFTKGINQNGYIMCLHCNMKKYEHPIFSYIYNITSQCDDIVLLIQEYIKNNNYNNNIACGSGHSIALLQDNLSTNLACIRLTNFKFKSVDRLKTCIHKFKI